ncbi:hypothetical protein F4820DRAFT_443617 [Hypoxylon rubiginosum]|uniref:Uncharacterized protein n=1 Tax=Hypoxylon rubiginosum TaxID=110542 RepID=A0ACB9ZDM4_9PEZI|nr:hypothetical protein F4820DRAFT_443617 [Hypoxylon rubiginosum]
MSALMDRGFILESLGDLAYLPRELIDMIIEQMDLNSAAKFTQVNRQAQLLLWSRNDYRFIRAVIFGHGLPIMREVITRSKPLLTTVNIQDLADLILAPESAVFKCHLWGRILVPSKLIYGYDDKTRTRCQDLFNDAKWVQLDRDALTGELIVIPAFPFSRESMKFEHNIPSARPRQLGIDICPSVPNYRLRTLHY